MPSSEGEAVQDYKDIGNGIEVKAEMNSKAIAEEDQHYSRSSSGSDCSSNIKLQKNVATDKIEAPDLSTPDDIEDDNKLLET